MLIDNPNKSYYIKLGGAITTNELTWVVNYLDTTRLQSLDGTTSGATPIEMVDGLSDFQQPPINANKLIKNVTIFNTDTVPQTVTVYLDNDSTVRTEVKVLLSVGYSLQYEIAEGWYVIDDNGARVNIDYNVNAIAIGDTVVGAVPNYYLYVDSSGNLAQGYLSQNANGVLIDNGKTISSANEVSILDFGSGLYLSAASGPGFWNINPTDAQFGWNNKYLTFNSSGITTNGNLVVGNTFFIADPSGNLQIDFGSGSYMQATTDAGAYSQGWWYIDPTIAELGFAGDQILFNGSSSSFNFGANSVGITAAELQLLHGTKLTFNSPIYNFASLTASTVPYLDASKNLVSTSIVADGNNLSFTSGNGIDTTATGGSDVLNIGATNANVINYGNSSTTHNFLGTAIYELQVNSYVTDKLMTLNYGGAAASGIGVGFEIQENSLITGYFKTNAARSGYSFLAPAIAYKADLSLASLTADAVFTLPNIAGTDTIATLAFAQAFTNKTYNGLTLTATTGTFTLTNGKTLTVSDSTTLAANSITFAGTEVLTLAATKSVTFADAFITSGAFSLTLTTTAATNVTFPTTGTLATLAGAEVFTNKTLTSPLISNNVGAVAGSIEYDGLAFYSTPTTGARGVSPSVMYSIIPAGDFALSTATGVQSCFPTTGDVWTLNSNTTYWVEGYYEITKSGNTTQVALAFALGGGASITSMNLIGWAGVNAVAPLSFVKTTVASVAVNVSSTTTAVIWFCGHIRMNAAGTVTPQISFNQSPTSPAMVAGSFLRFTAMGTDTNNILGNVA